MAFLIQEGFESGALSGWTLGSGTSIITSNGRYAGSISSLSINGSNINASNYTSWSGTRTFTSTKTMSVGFDMNLVLNTIYGPDNKAPILTLTYNGTINISIYLRYNSFVGKYYPYIAKSIVPGSGQTPAAPLYTGALLERFSQYGYNHYDLEFDAGIAGFARLYINGNLALNVPTGNFAAGSTELANGIFFNSPAYNETTPTNNQVYYDNLYIIDSATKLGEINVVTLRPNNDTVQKQWTPATGISNYSMVNATVYSNSQTNNVTSKVTSRDLYDVTDLTSVTTMDGKIHGMMVNSYGYKSTAGTIMVSNAMKTNNATFLGSQTLLNETQAASKFLSALSYTVNPTTGLAWTFSDINSLQTGIDITLASDFAFSIGQTGAINNNTTSTVVAGDTPPTVNSDGSLVFNGAQRIRYTDSPQFRVTAPYSVEFEFNTTSPATTQQIFNIGGDLVSVFPELEFRILSGALVVRTSSANNSGATTQTTILSSVTANTWYKIGFMMYNNGQNMMRIYVNGFPTIDVPVTQPYDSTGGTGIGGSINFPEYFVGSIRNLRVGQSLFYAVSPSYQNLVYSIGSNGTVSNLTGSSLASGDIAPTISGDDLVFTGTQRMRYTDAPMWHVASPYSVDFQFKTTSATTQQLLFNIGGDLVNSYPELMVNTTTTGGIAVWVNSNNANPNQSYTLAPNGTITANNYYRVGIMVYTLASVPRIRGYLNGTQIFDQTVTLPYDSTGGVSIGASLGAGSYLTGSIRALYVGQSTFWPI